MESSENPAGAKKEKPFASVRWWENYIVRYFVGSVVGAGIILFLVEPSLAKELLFRLETKSNEARDVNLLLLAAFGLAYCYIASAPMLTIHAARGQWDLVDMKLHPLRWAFRVACIAISAATLKSLFSISWKTMAFLNLLLFTIVLGLQLAFLIEAHWQKFRGIHSFYKSLSEARGDDRQSAEYVESYRHLREHANAYAIIILEFVLALALLAVSEHWQKVLVIFLWIIPSAYCWLIPTVLEARFAAEEKK